MSDFNATYGTTTNFSANVPDFIVQQRALDITNSNGETYWYFDYAPKYYAYYKEIPEVFSAVQAIITWAFNRGWKIVDSYGNEVIGSEMTAQLKHVRGQGKDSFTKIISSHWVDKLVIGDAFTEVKRDEKTNKILNMIRYSPERVRLCFGKDGLLKRYDVWDGKDWKAVKLSSMLHSRNKPVGDEVHGVPQLASAKKIIDARNEALDDERTIKHRDKALGIAYYQTDKEGKISYINTQIEKAVKNGEMLGLPEGTVKIEPYPSRSSEDRTGWIQYLENFFYQIFGVPRSIVSSDGTSEVGGKMGHVIFEPPYTREQNECEEDLWAQQQISIKFNRPPSLGGMQESKDTAQNIQPNDTAVTLNRE